MYNVMYIEEIKANTMDMDMELESIYENSPESREDIYNQALTIESSSLSEVETKQLDVNNGSHNKSRYILQCRMAFDYYSCHQEPFSVSCINMGMHAVVSYPGYSQIFKIAREKR